MLKVLIRKLSHSFQNKTLAKTHFVLKTKFDFLKATRINFIFKTIVHIQVIFLKYVKSYIDNSFQFRQITQYTSDVAGMLR